MSVSKFKVKLAWERTKGYKFIINEEKEYESVTYYEPRGMFIEDFVEIWRKSREQAQKGFTVAPMHYHEIIEGRQKLKLDIDDDTNKLASITRKIMVDRMNPEWTPSSSFMVSPTIQVESTEWEESIIASVKNVFRWNHQIDLLDSDIVICCSSNERKFSRHVIINNYYVSDHFQAMKFAESVVSDMRVGYSHVAKCVDMQVYNETQNFRIAGSSKCKDPNRVKKIITKHSLLDSLITNISECKALEDAYRVVENESEDYEMLDLDDEFIAIAKDELPGMQFSKRKDNILLFKRISHSYCSLCARDHDAENAYVTMVAQDQSVCYYHHCYRAGGASRLIHRQQNVDVEVAAVAKKEHVKPLGRLWKKSRVLTSRP